MRAKKTLPLPRARTVAQLQAPVIFDWSSAPAWLRKLLPKAIYIGSGCSSHVWSLPGGLVLKATRDIETLRFFTQELASPTRGIARTVAVIDRCCKPFAITREDGSCDPLRANQRALHAIVQRRCAPLARARWAHLMRVAPPTRRKDQLWSHAGDLPMSEAPALRVIERLIGRGEALARKGSSNPAAQALPALRRLREHLQERPQAGLDIDHIDNWGTDSRGRSVLIDPLFDLRICARPERVGEPLS